MPSFATPTSVPSARLASLEGLRGVAALIVVVWHTLLAFAPATTGLFAQFPATQAWTGTPFFVLMNGDGAVNVFFVLSGFVLSRRFFLTGETSSIVENAIKRYPRLMMPVLLSVLLSYALFQSGLYRFQEAASLSGSPWLARFGNAFETPFAPSLWGALKQGAFYTFLRGDSFYNSSLWTMKYEFYASFMIFGGALLLAESQRYNRFYPLYLTAVIIALSWYASPWYVCFAIGLALARFMPAEGIPLVNRAPLLLKCLLVALALCCLGFHQPTGLYRMLRGFNPIAVNCVGSSVLIVLLASVHVTGRLKSICAFLGLLSFPLYLVHIPILFSVGCSLYIASAGTLFQNPSIMVAVSMALCVLASLPFIWVNERWLSGLNRFFKT